jgi:hypothetical protein
VNRKPVELSLTDHVAAQPHADAVVVALAAGQIELAPARIIERLALIKERLRGTINGDIHRLSARLHGNVGRQGQQVFGLISQRRDLHVRLAFAIDAHFQIDQAIGCRIENRVTRRHARH